MSPRNGKWIGGWIYELTWREFRFQDRMKIESWQQAEIKSRVEVCWPEHRQIRNPKSFFLFPLHLSSHHERLFLWSLASTEARKLINLTKPTDNDDICAPQGESSDIRIQASSKLTRAISPELLINFAICHAKKNIKVFRESFSNNPKANFIYVQAPSKIS
jgi:hypothetical protein